MHTCLDLIEQALVIGQQELAALRNGNPVEAQEREEERGRLTRLALESCRDLPLDVLLPEFQKLNELQKELTRAAEELQRIWREELSVSRQRGRSLAGYKQTIEHALQ